MSRFFFPLDGGDSLDYLSVIYCIFRIGPGVGVGAGVGVDQEPGVGVGVGVGTARPLLRTPDQNEAKQKYCVFCNFVIVSCQQLRGQDSEIQPVILCLLRHCE